ncbi:hypothetical protein L596_015645 [Steinernema carpocapsae]|uniref:Uncharacterized protein n=1 Tax=Steinernema carpocapsae TaxID=34508 RepID=A0A4U5NGL2_STECR|nr:hypothetical protein L596_015645 [Steinernema carpocapsae]
MWWSFVMSAAISLVVSSKAAPATFPGPSHSPLAVTETVKVRRPSQHTSHAARTGQEDRYSIWEIIHKRFRDPRLNKAKDIIWSPESKFHPDFGRIVDSVGDDRDRVSVYSLYMSFGILGFVITFIVYSYLQYLIAARRLRRQMQDEHVQFLIRRSAYLLASSGCDAPALKRRGSILNLFKQFRL